MKPHTADWDREERDALKDVEHELDALRARHADDPPLDVLRAARGHALPDELQARVSSHLSGSAWSRRLVEGADDVDAALTAEDQRRILDRIRRGTGETRPLSVWSRLWIPALATAGIAVIAVAVVHRGDQPVGPTGPVAVTPGTPTVPAPSPAPRFQLVLEKPDVKLSPGAFTYRGTVGDKGFLADVKPALDAYRRDDYALANREFSALASRYPQSVEVVFYQGISRLFLNDTAGADDALTIADRLNEPTFAADVAWYRAIVDQRAGRVADARTRLDGLCRAENHARRAQACDAANRLKQ